MLCYLFGAETLSTVLEIREPADPWQPARLWEHPHVPSLPGSYITRTEALYKRPTIPGDTIAFFPDLQWQSSSQKGLHPGKKEATAPRHTMLSLPSLTAHRRLWQSQDTGIAAGRGRASPETESPGDTHRIQVLDPLGLQWCRASPGTCFSDNDRRQRRETE
ncbi:hypothetical protein NDU88_000286 [Pleurodeles waltl]|uniref:Uncharacterized protein n=1 Tax=Pleurodeles waltl TaxID=8319 RepID=A0AAV7MRF5_PLEWA|nr:hypothetical protein NDU88_000286 [Pleurodeles waltl]